MNYILYVGLKIYASYLDASATAKLSLLQLKSVTLERLADEMCRRISNIFIPDKGGKRAVHGNCEFVIFQLDCNPLYSFVLLSWLVWYFNLSWEKCFVSCLICLLLKYLD